MSEFEANQEISALVDGELQGPARDRVVSALYGNAELRRAWARYHLIREAVRKIGPVPGACSIAGKVSEALSGERIVPFKPRAGRPWPGPLPGLALAASVAAIAILGVRGLDDGHDGGTRLSAAGASRHEMVAAGFATTVTDPPSSRVVALTTTRSETDRMQWSGAPPDAKARLNAYLVNYNEYAGNGVRGVLPYVRIVGYQTAAGDDRRAPP